MHRRLLLAPIVLVTLAACAHTRQERPVAPTAEDVFRDVAPSVVAILNDDRDDRDQDLAEAQQTLGDEAKAPKSTIDVSLRKDPMPHGTGFLIEGGQIATAAHVVLRPDRLKVTTRKGQTVEAELVRIDAVRDIAILKPKEPLRDVPPIALADAPPEVGQPVWAMGHTGRGFWALSWGMSQGIASGMVDLFGARLILFDAAIFPGFSGGPVVAIGPNGKPRVVGIDHAILYTGSGGITPTGPISSAVAVSELREVLAGHAHAMQPKVAEYARAHRGQRYADVFVTDRLSVGRDAHGMQVASIMGHASRIERDAHDTRVPAVAMLFGLPQGEHEINFELRDPQENIVADAYRTVKVGEHQRVSFVSGSMRFPAEVHGHYRVVAKLKNQELGHAHVAIELPDDDDDLHEDVDDDMGEDGKPDVDIVVAQVGNPNPLLLGGIRTAWAEKSYPRRVDFTWFARGTRGWSGTNIVISAYVLDEDGNIVGRSDGCFQSELRPERTWSCVGSGSAMQPPLPLKAGAYDIVFALNDRPVAWWPMEAALRKDSHPGSDIDRWAGELRRSALQRQKQQGATPGASTKPAPKTPDPVKPEPKKPAPKPPTKPVPAKAGAH